MIIKKAVLHILDLNSNVSVLSQQPLDFSDTGVSEYIEKHIEKIHKDSSKKSGEFTPDSRFAMMLADYTHNELDFIELSTQIAGFMYEQLSISDRLEPSDLLIADCIYENVTYFVILLLANKTAFTHQVVNDESGLHNEIIRHYAILPPATQKPEAYAIINCDTMEVQFLDKRVSIDGQSVNILPERLLECTQQLSTKEAVKIVKQITESVAEEYGENSAMAVSKAKSIIAESAEEQDSICPFDLAEQVFSESPVMKEAFEKKAEEAQLPRDVRIEKQFFTKSSRSHKIKTDTGIEITIPVEYFDNEEYLEFINNPDGTISIQLKNIGKILNR